MNRKYMDFVPGNPQKNRTAPKKRMVTRPRPEVETVYGVVRETSYASKVSHTREVFNGDLRGVERTEPVRSERPAPEAALGVVEDLSPKFTRTNVSKRPLGSQAHFKVQKSEISQIKAKKVGIRDDVNFGRSGEQSASRGQKTGLLVEKPVEKYNVPKTPFINQDKVQKRPLSKNVYSRKVISVKEEPKGPVTIIAKPEKDSKIGLVVTIILTIILGAAAGTVAFLLLPK